MQTQCAAALQHLDDEKPANESRRDLANASKSARFAAFYNRNPLLFLLESDPSPSSAPKCCLSNLLFVAA
jgi:hypothetical protein